MNTYIALLRGINVGGHKKVSMADLRALLSKHGFQDVKTYIQSGNVVFRSEVADNRNIASKISQAILDHFGFDVSIIIKTRDEIQLIMDDCPFPSEKKENSYFTMLDKMPENDLVEAVSNLTYPNEEFYLIKNCIYSYYSTGYGNAKFNTNVFERKFKIAMTSRNYRTMMKLLSLSEEL